MAGAYFLSYLLRPWRIVRSLRNIFLRRRSETVFEQRIIEMWRNLGDARRRRSGTVSAER